VWFYIYETKGLSLEQVDELYNEVSVARKSKHWKPTITFKQRESVAAQGGVVSNDSEKVEVADEGGLEPTARHREGGATSEAV